MIDLSIDELFGDQAHRHRRRAERTVELLDDLLGTYAAADCIAIGVGGIGAYTPLRRPGGSPPT